MADEEARMVEAGIKTVNAILAPTSVSNAISYRGEDNNQEENNPESEYALITNTIK